MVRERFDRYMARCLYDPERGFYASGAGSAGRGSGDFITSPEVGPLFADVLANALDAWWDDLGNPDPFIIHDAGTGPGTLARMLERAPGRSKHVRRVAGFDRADGSGAPPPGLKGSVVIANELLDNVPFRIVERKEGTWHEVWVIDEGGSASVEQLAAPEPALASRQLSLLAPVPDGIRVPLLDEAADWVQGVLDQQPAVLLVFDYGLTSTVDLARRGGWLRTYRGHERGHDPFLQPGRWDITTDLAVDQLPPPDEVTSQGEFLKRWGIEALVEEGREVWKAKAAAPDVAALKMRSRITEAEALLDPAGLGGWLACRWGPVSSDSH